MTAAVLFFTFLTVGFALLHVKGLVPDGSLAGCTLETLNMVGHLQSMHDFLTKGEKVCNLVFLLLKDRGDIIIIHLVVKNVSGLCYNFP